MSSEPTEPHSHQNIQHNGETYIKLSDAAETFKSLRAWRVALYDALTEWHDPPRDGETPKAALRRLVHTEILAALDPAISRPAADLIATARREGMEEAAKRLEELHKNHKYNRKTGEGSEHDVGYYRAIAEGVAHILRAAAKDEKPC
jgi:hypothetical protein